MKSKDELRRNRSPRWYRQLGAIGALCMVIGIAGCGLDTPDRGDDEHDHAHGDSDIRVGSAARGGGELGLDYDFRRAVELGCEEIVGMEFCTAEDPGFVHLESASPVFFPIPDGVEVRLELVAADEGARVVVRGTILDAPGESAVLGSTAEDLHVHPQWQVVAPRGTLAATYEVSFRLTTDAEGFQDSEGYTLRFRIDS